MNSKTSKKNGKKGGRPRYDNSAKFKLPDTEFVVLTQNQYYTLVQKYGITVISSALKIFELWLTTSYEGNKYLGKNNYAHFRSDGWVINTAKQCF